MLAHGSTQGFGCAADEDELGDGAGNQLDLTQLPAGAYDYIALGDWHGTKQITPHAWYSGTPDLDRFPKGGEHDPGNILLVTATRGTPPDVVPLRTARIGWHSVDFTFADDTGVDQLEAHLRALLGPRVGQDLLRINLNGSLGLAATSRLEHLLESLQARLIRIKLSTAARVAPSAEETLALTQRGSDPLISRVATALVARAAGEGEDADIARIALRELHAQIAAPEAGAAHSLGR